MGSVRYPIRSLTDSLQERFSHGEKLVVFHITLAGPFSMDHEEWLIEDFTRVCTCKAGIPKDEIGGYWFFDDAGAVFVYYARRESEAGPVPVLPVISL